LEFSGKMHTESSFQQTALFDKSCDFTMARGQLLSIGAKDIKMQLFTEVREVFCVNEGA